MENGTEYREIANTATEDSNVEIALRFYRKFKHIPRLFAVLVGMMIILLSLAGVKLHYLKIAQPELTEVHIEETMTEIRELAVMSFEYTNQKTITDSRKIFGFDIPGTTNTLTVVYSGIIKVGYDNLSAPAVNKEKKTLIFTLPEAKVLDNYIILDTLQCTDGNNILNPIGSDDIIGYFNEIEAEELARAEELDIYAAAEEQVKSIITHYFAVFPDYEVLFIEQ